MRVLHSRRALLAVTVLMTVAIMLFWRSSSSDSDSSNSVLGLKAPSFVSEVYADSEVIQEIADEAGMSAYYQAPSTINLAEVRDAFRTIEVETPNYMIGSVPVTNYPEDQDVHVYVHVDGWILAYYLVADPVGKIFDWRVYHDTGRTNITTKLENTLAVVAGEAAVSYTGGTHYHFQYPNATHLMFIVDYTNSGDDSFELNVPSSFAYSERSWSLATNDLSHGLLLDGADLIDGLCCGFLTAEGMISPSQLLPDQFHTVTLDFYRGYTYGGIALVYREQ